MPTEIVAMIVPGSMTTTLVAVGAGPVPFSTVPFAPLAKPEPRIWTPTVAPAFIEFGVIWPTITCGWLNVDRDERRSMLKLAATQSLLRRGVRIRRADPDRRVLSK